MSKEQCKSEFGWMLHKTDFIDLYSLQVMRYNALSSLFASIRLNYIEDNELVIFYIKISHENALFGVKKRVRSTSFFNAYDASE